MEEQHEEGRQPSQEAGELRPIPQRPASALPRTAHPSEPAQHAGWSLSLIPTWADARERASSPDNVGSEHRGF